MKTKQAVLSLLSVALFATLAGWLLASLGEAPSTSGAVAAGATGAAIGVLVSFNPLVRRLAGLSDEPLLGGAARRIQSLGPFERNELVALALGEAGLAEAARRVRFSPVELSYRGAADFLMAEGLAAEPSERRRYALALASLYCFDGMSDDSLAIVRRAVLRLADPAPVDLDALARRRYDEWTTPIELRDAMAGVSAARAERTPLSA